MASLESVRYKIFRAKQHRHSLVSAIQRYMENPPGEIVARVNATQKSVVVVNAPSIGAEIPLIVGDSIQNLRSSLDYLVWELCLAAGHEPSQSNAFPICKNENFFRDAIGRGSLRGLGAEAQAEIARLQPYASDAAKWECTSLWILNELCNLNKHRRIMLAAIEAAGINEDSGRILKSDANVIHLPSGEVKVDNVAIFVSITERIAKNIEACSLLDQITNFIEEDILPRFEPFF